MKKLLLLPILFITLTSLAQIRDTIQYKSGLAITGTVKKEIPNMHKGLPGFAASAGIFDNKRQTTRGFLQFDLSFIPKGSKVNWARLTLYATRYDVGFNNSKLMRITSSWNANTVTWNTQPTVTKRGQVSLGIVASYEVYKNINVTNLLQQMVDSPETSFGFEMKLDSESRTDWREVQFKAHSNSTSSLNFPKLVFEYTPPSLQPEVSSVAVGNGYSTEMTIYPNPCNKAFNCNIRSADPENMTLSVMDMLGRTVYRQSVNASSLQLRVNLPTISAGTYFVVLQDSKNETVVSQQVQVN